MSYVPDVMRKRVYDVNENQSVDSAEDADTVDGIHGSELLKRDGSTPMTGDLQMNGYGIKDVPEISGVSGSGTSLWGSPLTGQSHLTIFAKDHSTDPNKIVLTTYVGGVAKDVLVVEPETDHPKFPQGFETDTISEMTTDAGVTIDGCLIKDGKAAMAEKAVSLTGIVKQRLSISAGESFTVESNECMTVVLPPGKKFSVDGSLKINGSFVLFSL